MIQQIKYVCFDCKQKMVLRDKFYQCPECGEIMDENNEKREYRISDISPEETLRIRRKLIKELEEFGC